ncbi:MAG: prepilin-type N-terminal cleavage/methylation domain-containing protein [Candidatus Omnitrophica bacterium]|nr:prepilin-type N-terminal cleavage/methylation domain-containing protein [Candidatus Omnitrophota bacterium]
MKRKGFTLIEIMIVIMVICLLSAVSIPIISRARVTGQETNAATNLNSIALAEIQRRSLNGTFVDLTTLSNEKYIDSLLGNGAKQGYSYTMFPVSTPNRFHACAVHQQGQGHSFYIDDRGALCRSVNPGQSCPSYQAGACTGQWAGLTGSSGSGGGVVIGGGIATGATGGASSMSPSGGEAHFEY